MLVQRLGQQSVMEARLPEDADEGAVTLTLVTEDGSTSRRALRAVLVPAATDTHDQRGSHRRVSFDLTRLADDPLPAGYHRLVLEGAGEPEEALVIAAPVCPGGPRTWGAFLPLHALRTESDDGVGTYSDLARLADWVTSLGGGFVGTLPLYPAFLDPPADPSPYLPVSRLAYNELFIDPRALPEYAASRRDGESGGTEPDAGDLVDYEALARRRRRQLEPMARAVCSGEWPERCEQLAAFAVAHPELAAYARFRAARETVAGNGLDPDVAEYHLYTQWVACEQLAAAGRRGGRYADLPIGSHPEGFDPVWAPDSFVPGVQGGAPPDRFFAGGQSWGFRPLHPEGIRRDGYGFFIAALRRAFLHADCLRIDHVMGLQRMYMIPEGHDATDGAYVSYRAEELHALVALEAWRAGAQVVGEDLGTVPEEVRDRMRRDHMLRSWVFQFESTTEEPLPDPGPTTLASLGTHDLPRFGSYLWGQDLGERAAMGHLSAREASAEHAARTRWRQNLFDILDIAPDEDPEQLTLIALAACLRHLARSEARVVLVDLEELWDERRAQNHPGTTAKTNWSQRARRTFEDFSTDTQLAQTLSTLTMERSA